MIHVIAAGVSYWKNRAAAAMNKAAAKIGEKLISRVAAKISRKDDVYEL